MCTEGITPDRKNNNRAFSLGIALTKEELWLILDYRIKKIKNAK